MNESSKLRVLLTASQEEKLQKLSKNLKGGFLFLALVSDLGQSSGSLEIFNSFCMLWGLGTMW